MADYPRPLPLGPSRDGVKKCACISYRMLKPTLPIRIFHQGIRF